MIKRALLPLVILCVTAACAFRSKQRVITATDVADPVRTRMTNYMSAPVRPGSPSEKTPSAISRATVADEATVESWSGDDVCFNFVIRTHVGLDSPLSEWEVTVNEQRAHFGEETISVRDYSYAGEREVFAAQGVTASAFATLRLTEPTENVYRVVERAAQLCARLTTPSAKVVVELLLPQDDRRGNWGERFEWTMR